MLILFDRANHDIFIDHLKERIDDIGIFGAIPLAAICVMIWYWGGIRIPLVMKEVSLPGESDLDVMDKVLDSVVTRL